MKDSQKKRLVVITGASCSGKSSVINELSLRGYNVITEVPRIILESRKSFEASKEEIYKRQKLIWDLQLYLEELSEGLVFCDRGLIDGLGYCDFFKIEDNFADKNILNKRYLCVFEMEPLGFVKDNIRIENNEKDVGDIYDCVRKRWESFRYNMIPVKSFSSDPEEDIKLRADYILECLEGLFINF